MTIRRDTTPSTDTGRPVGRPASVWATGQRPANHQRGTNYVSETTKHPSRMLPDLARYAIESLTEPGDLVFDPMCGAGTTLIEALRLGRHAVGVDVEPEWASLARANIAHLRTRGIGGYGHVVTADARALPDSLPPAYREQMTGRVALVLTSPPYGSATHGRVRHTDAGIVKWNHRYATARRAAQMAHHPLHRLLAGLTNILAGCLPLLAPGGYVVLTARPWREHGELVDLPGALADAALAAGLVPVQRCVALLAGLRDQQLITRASFFQRTAVSKARAEGLPWHLVSHEDVYVLRAPRASRAAVHQRRAAARRSSRGLAALDTHRTTEGSAA